MSRLKAIDPENATASTREVFRSLVTIPNLFCILANSTPFLRALTAHAEHLDEYRLAANHRKMIALAVSQFNDCPYCVSWHTSLAVDHGILTPQECIDARRMMSAQPEAQAILHLTKAVLESRGHVTDQILEQMRDRGVSDQEIIEVIAIIAVVTQANYTANLSEPEVDLRPAPPLDRISRENTE